MAKILGVYSTNNNCTFFRITTYVDCVVMFIMSIVAITHASIVGEGAAVILAIFHLLYTCFGVLVSIKFNAQKEIQTYENFIYAKSRQMWNVLCLFIISYLTIMSAFWAFSKTNKTELLSVFVFHILSIIYIFVAIMLFKQMINITKSKFSAADESNYLESNNQEEKITKSNDKIMKIDKLWGSDTLFDSKNLKTKNKKNNYYEVNQGMEYINIDTKSKIYDSIGHGDMINETSNFSE